MKAKYFLGCFLFMCLGVSCISCMGLFKVLAMDKNPNSRVRDSGDLEEKRIPERPKSAKGKVKGGIPSGKKLPSQGSNDQNR